MIDYFINNPEPIERKNNVTAWCFKCCYKRAIEKGILSEMTKEVYRDPYKNRTIEKTEPLPLTSEQSQAIQPILQSLSEKRHDVFLLYGVTGSGKTEIYLTIDSKSPRRW